MQVQQHRLDRPRMRMVMTASRISPFETARAYDRGIRRCYGRAADRSPCSIEAELEANWLTKLALERVQPHCQTANN